MTASTESEKREKHDLRLLERYRDRAERLLDPAVWDYVETGAGDEISLRDAESAWRRWRFRPRVLRDVGVVDTSLSLLGTTVSSPILVAPTATHDAYHSDGELATARGVAAADSLLCLSTRSTRRIEDVAAELDGPWWMQVYVAQDRALTEMLVTRAAAAGATALVLTGDTPYVSRRARSGRAVPLGTEASLVNVADHLDGRDPAVLEEDATLTLETIQWLQQVSGLPVLVKGVLRGDDATACIEAGAAGVVVSNHGGRQLDRAVPTADALPEVVDAVGDRATVLVDGGIRSAYDVLTALALGADAVLLGRPILHALAVDGADGVRQTLQTTTWHLGHLMGLLGVTSPADVRHDHVTPARWVE